MTFASSMRVVDIAGLVAFMIAGLVVVAFLRPLAHAFVITFRGRGTGRVDRASETLLRAGLLFLAGGDVVLCALTLLKVIEVRPGHYPGGALDGVIGACGLAALAVLVARSARGGGA